MPFRMEDMKEMWPKGSSIAIVKHNHNILFGKIICYLGDKLIFKDDEGDEHFIYPHSIKYVISEGVIHIAIQRD